VGGNHSIHPTAQIVGAVILHGNVTVERQAKILGPALIGAGACVRAGAVVAQTTVASGCIVLPGQVIWHRALYEGHTSPPAGDSPSGLSRKLQPQVVDEPEQAPEGRKQGTLLAVKRILDTFVAAVCLVLLSPLLLAVAILIRLDSRGSILYGHRREGRRAREFRCWKFRTMCEDADARQRELYAANSMDGPQFKLDTGPRGDPRVTRVGRLLRSTNLDELPQLFNVVLGQMSLIGPRPSPFRENQVCVAWRDARLSVRPGLTGLWQVCRHDRANGDFHQWIEYDLLYVQNMSLWLDLKILIATVLTLGGKRHVAVAWMVSAEPSTLMPRSESASAE
jgi:lipopolysaccharide/colanic/teichoic acid biosynthesis glycosyltransferase